MSGLNLNDMVPGQNVIPKQSIRIDKPVKTSKPKQEVSSKENVSVIDEPVLQKKKVQMCLLKCGECGIYLSVGKKQESKLLHYKLFCPECKKQFITNNFLVATSSYLWHRPFSNKGQEQFDLEIEKLKKAYPEYIEESLK